MAADLRGLLAGLGWTEDALYLADAPVGTAFGMRRETRLALVSVMWVPASGANCSPDRPIIECPLRSEQMFYTITLQLAQLRQTDGSGDIAKAREALLAFFAALHEGRYGAAVAYWGGDCQALPDRNPDIPADDYARLFQNGCTMGCAVGSQGTHR